MNNKKIFIGIVFAIAITAAFGLQNSSEHKVLFEKAKFTMETKGDLKGAIKLFKEIIQKYPDQREYAAKSQLYIGLCYEKLGLKEAQKAYQKVIDSYPEQTEAVRVANEKLSLFLRAEAVIRKEDKEFNIRKVWAGPDVSLDAAPSPDGRYISYKDRETGDLSIREIATGKTRRLTKKGTMKQPMQFVLNSVISPDSKLVAYTWTNEYTTYDICLIGIDGSGDRILYSGKYDQLHTDSWSSDGKQVAFRKYITKEGNLEIILVSVADGSIQVLKTFEKPFWPRFCYSSNDRFITYDFPVAENSGNYDINLLAIDGSGEIPLIEHPANDRLLGWVPNREEMLFVSNRTGTYDIWAIEVANGKQRACPGRLNEILVKFYLKDLHRMVPFTSAFIPGGLLLMLLHLT